MVEATNGLTWLSFRPLETGPVTVAIAHPKSTVAPDEIHYHIWANGDVVAIETMIERMPRILGIDEAALAGWAAFDELLADTAHLLPHQVVEARRKNPGMRLMSTGQLVDELYTVVLEQKVTQRQARATWRWFADTFGEASLVNRRQRSLLPQRQSCKFSRGSGTPVGSNPFWHGH